MMKLPKNIVKLLFGEDIFSEIIGDKAGLKRKPDPGKVLMIAQNWQLKPQENSLSWRL